jgi:hypothetical protein
MGGADWPESTLAAPISNTQNAARTARHLNVLIVPCEAARGGRVLIVLVLTRVGVQRDGRFAV